MKLDAEVPTHKFEVDAVKLLEGNCASVAASRYCLYQGTSDLLSLPRHETACQLY